MHLLMLRNHSRWRHRLSDEQEFRGSERGALSAQHRRPVLFADAQTLLRVLAHELRGDRLDLLERIAAF
jgi:hypothetical protein